MSNKENTAELLKKVQIYQDNIAQQSSALDKAILTLSAGSLALSVQFVAPILSGEAGISVTAFVYLIFCWFLFMIAIVVTLWSFISSIEASKLMQQVVKNLHDYNNEKNNDFFLKAQESVINAGKINKLIRNLSIISLMLFILGASCFFYFSGQTLYEKIQSNKVISTLKQKDKAMTDDKKLSTEDEEKRGTEIFTDILPPEPDIQPNEKDDNNSD